MIRLARFLFDRARKICFAILLASFVGGLANVLFIALIQKAMTGAAESRRAMLWSVATLCVIAPTARIVSQTLLVKLAENSLADMVVKFSRQVLATPLRKVEELGSHRIIAALTEDVVSIAVGLMDLPIIALHSVIIVACLIYLGTISPIALLWVIGFIAPAAFCIWLGSRSGFSYFQKARNSLDSVFKDLRSLTLGVKELKIHANRREVFLSEVLGRDMQRYRGRSLVARTVFSAVAGLGQWFFYMLLGCMVFVVPTVSSTPRSVATAFVVMLFFLLGSIEAIWNAVPELSRASVALANLQSLGLELAPKEKQRVPMEVRGPTGSSHWQIKLDSVTHRYRTEADPSTFVLGPISLTISSAEIVFVLGPNGSGKTTLVKMLTGLYTPEAGGIYLNGSQVVDENREAYRQNFSAVFSDFHLFEQLLGIGGDNLDERAHRLLIQLRLDHCVTIKEGSFSTLDLSQGQKKRLALLTACLEDRQAFVFDEWAADQDPAFKHVFYTQLLPELKARSKAVIVITHDERYCEFADRIVRIENGNLVSVKGSAVHERVSVSEYLSHSSANLQT